MNIFLLKYDFSDLSYCARIKGHTMHCIRLNTNDRPPFVTLLALIWAIDCEEKKIFLCSVHNQNCANIISFFSLSDNFFSEFHLMLQKPCASDNFFLSLLQQIIFAILLVGLIIYFIFFQSSATEYFLEKKT